MPLQVVKAVLPDPQTLAPGYTGKTCIGNIVTGTRDGRRREVFIYQVSDHAAAYAEVGSQAISYTAGVPPIAAARLIVSGEWDAGRMVNVEELDPVPFIGLLDQMGLPTETLELDPDGAGPLRRHGPRPGDRDRRLGRPRDGLGRRPDARRPPVLNGRICVTGSRRSTTSMPQ